MILKDVTLVGNAPRPQLKAWRERPDVFNYALAAARHYARKHKQRFVVVPVKRYNILSSVNQYDLTTESSSITYHTGFVPKDGLKVHIVASDGSVYKAIAFENEVKNHG